MILNPITNREVKKDGAVGKKIIKCLEKEKNKIVKKVILEELSIKKEFIENNTSSSFMDTKKIKEMAHFDFIETIGYKAFKDCMKTIKNRGYNIKYLDSGNSGSIYIACTKIKNSKYNCSYIIKVQLLGNIYSTEIEVLKRTKNALFTPTSYDSWECDGLGFLVINRLVKCLDPIKRIKEILNILDTLDKKYEILYLDFHKGNIMCDPKTKKIILIDFGDSAIKNRPDLLRGNNCVSVNWEYTPKYIPKQDYNKLRIQVAREIKFFLEGR